MQHVSYVLCVLLACLSHRVIASSGDRLPAYQHCLSALLESNNTSTLLENTPAESLTQWTPLAQAKYHCMQQINDRTVREYGQTHQYYGKWPFRRFLGIQEPASVLFSLLNLYAHAR